MAEFSDREHYIPIRKAELVGLLAADRGLQSGQAMSADDGEAFRQFAKLLSAEFHFEYHAHLDRLKDLYAPFDPDADTKLLSPPDDAARAETQDALFAEVTGILEKANYTRLTEQQIVDATAAASEWGLNMDVDLKAFERIEVYVRGQVMGKRTHRFLRNWYRIEEVTVPIYQRLVVVLKQKPHARFGPEADTKSVFLKMFKDIPRADLEMVVPGTRVKMPGLDRFKLGGSLLSALALAGYQIVTKFWALVLALVGGAVNVTGLLLGPIALLAGYGYKQFAGYQQTKQAYTLKLTQSLYYQNLGSNQGVLTRLLDEAEEQEFREALLGYYYLWRYAGDKGWTAEQLDDYAEIDLERRAGVKVDFEIGDALAKLERLNLVERAGDAYKAVPVAAALDRLDTLWDGHFKYSGTAAV